MVRKIEIFIGDDAKSLQDQVNQWIDKNKINVIYTKTNIVSTGNNSYLMSITIVYEEQK